LSVNEVIIRAETGQRMASSDRSERSGVGVLIGAILAPMPINRAWHERHRMPERATLDDRVAWHVEHASVCGCRPMPRTVVDELARRDRVQQEQQQQQ
jgi:hypothetical protein